jgi:hypothetical protein
MRIAIVSRDEATRRRAAAAFDAAPAGWSVSLHDSAPEEADVVVCGPDADIPGALRFDPAAPGDLVARIAATKPGARAVAVVGASGGVGTTTLALHLARAFARSGSVCYVERSASCGGRLRLALPEDARRWAGTDGPERSALPVPGGFRALLAPPEGTAEAVPDAARSGFERVVLDAGTAVPEDGPRVLVLVAPPSRAGMHRAGALLDAHPGRRWAVVTNRTGPGGGAGRAALEDALGRRIALQLPCSRGVRDREDEGALLPEWSRFSWGVTRLARALERQATSPDSVPRWSG